MHWIHPQVLWALLALVIPILIHLFYFRRYRTQYFSNTAWLQEIKNVQKNNARLKHLMVLLMRLLAFAFLVFAFAKPFLDLDAKGQKTADAICIYIDNSFSMQRKGQELTVQEEAVQLALQIVQAQNPNLKFQITDNDFKPDDQAWLSQDQAINRIQSMQASAASRNMSEVIQRQDQLLFRSTNEHAKRMLITDGQKHFFETMPQVDSTMDMELYLLPGVIQENISIDSSWIAQPILLPGNTAKFYVRIMNHSKVDVQNLGLSSLTGSTKRSVGSYDIPAGQSIETEVKLPVPQKKSLDVAFVIDDSYITFDDSLWVSHAIQNRISVMYIGSNLHLPYFRAAYQAQGHTDFDAVNPQKIVYSNFERQQLIILDDLVQISSGLSDALVNYINQGGQVFFIPNQDGDLTSYNDFFSRLRVPNFEQLRKEPQTVLEINDRSQVFADVFLKKGDLTQTPSVQSYYTFKRGSGVQAEEILGLRNGRPFLQQFDLAAGQLYVLSTSVDPKYSDLMQEGSFFVPMLHNMSLAGGQRKKLYQTIGKSNRLQLSTSLRAKDPVFELQGTAEAIIPYASKQKNGAYSIFEDGQLSHAGMYKLNYGDTSLMHIAYNYNRAESDMDVYKSESEISDLPNGIRIQEVTNLKRAMAAAEQANQAQPLWFWCVIMALLFLLIEALILRYF